MKVAMVFTIARSLPALCLSASDATVMIQGSARLGVAGRDADVDVDVDVDVDADLDEDAQLEIQSYAELLEETAGSKTLPVPIPVPVGIFPMHITMGKDRTKEPPPPPNDYFMSEAYNHHQWWDPSTDPIFNKSRDWTRFVPGVFHRPSTKDKMVAKLRAAKLIPEAPSGEADTPSGKAPSSDDQVFMARGDESSGSEHQARARGALDNLFRMRSEKRVGVFKGAYKRCRKIPTKEQCANANELFALTCLGWSGTKCLGADGKCLDLVTEEICLGNGYGLSCTWTQEGEKKECIEKEGKAGKGEEAAQGAATPAPEASAV